MAQSIAQTLTELGAEVRPERLMQELLSRKPMAQQGSAGPSLVVEGPDSAANSVAQVRSWARKDAHASLVPSHFGLP